MNRRDRQAGRGRRPRSRSRGGQRRSPPSSGMPPTMTRCAPPGSTAPGRSWRRSSDAENLFVTLRGGRSTRDLFIVARAREDASVAKLRSAGADRVVNPQELGAARMAAFVLRPHVAEFIDVVMHDRTMEFRMQEVEVPEGSCHAGTTLRDANLRRARRRLGTCAPRAGRDVQHQPGSGHGDRTAPRDHRRGHRRRCVNSPRS